jgi:hypothetical protein
MLPPLDQISVLYTSAGMCRSVWYGIEPTSALGSDNWRVLTQLF